MNAIEELLHDAVTIIIADKRLYECGDNGTGRKAAVILFDKFLKFLRYINGNGNGLTASRYSVIPHEVFYERACKFVIKGLNGSFGCLTL